MEPSMRAQPVRKHSRPVRIELRSVVRAGNGPIQYSGNQKASRDAERSGHKTQTLV
jgi:hypothetical protein